MNDVSTHQGPESYNYVDADIHVCLYETLTYLYENELTIDN